MTVVHEFSNGLRVYKSHLLEKQLERYRKCNLHEPEEEAIFVSEIKGARVYLDIGGAIGYYPILATMLVPEIEVHVAEPLSRHRGYIQENMVLNNVAPASVGIHPIAVSDRMGQADFVDLGYSSYVRTHSRKIDKLIDLIHPKRRVDKVQIVTLAELCSRIHKPIDLCQMDVQGHELIILRGAEQQLAEKRIGKLLIGTHSLELHRDCVEILNKHNYSIKIDRFETHSQPDGIVLAVAI